MENGVCIVGGGPAGLTMGRILAHLGVPFTIYERAAEIGGIWNDRAEGTPIYDSAHLISSRTMTEFDGYPMPESWPDYPGRALVGAYIRAFAEDAGLMERTRLGVAVEAASPGEGGWGVRLSDGTTAHYRWLVCANGATWTPREARFEGEFDGVIRHSATYRSKEEFRGKRVLVVGGGNSGADIACDAAEAAAFAAISLRRGYHVVPKHILGKPADVFARDSPPLPFRLRQIVFGFLLRRLVGDTTKLGLPKPDHRILETHPLLNDQMLHHLRHGDLTALPAVERLDRDGVLFADGRREKFDEIVLATGYAWDTPYLEGLDPLEEGRRRLPLCIFAPEREDLFLLSFVKAAGSSITLFNEMAWVIARAIETQAAGGEKLEKLRRLIAANNFDVMGGLRMVESDRHAAYVNRDAYVRALVGLRKAMGWPAAETLPALPRASLAA